MIICYTAPETWCVTEVNCIFHFGLSFALLPMCTFFPLIILHMCTKNYDHMMHGFWDMVRDRWLDRQTEKVTYTGGCPTSKTWEYILYRKYILLFIWSFLKFGVLENMKRDWNNIAFPFFFCFWKTFLNTKIIDNW